VRKPPGGEIQSFRGRIFSPTVIRISLEARAHLLRQFPAHSDGYRHQGEFSGFYNSYRELPDCFLPIYPCMRRPTPVLLVTGTRPAAEWPPRDNGCSVDKGKTNESGTLVVDGGGMSPPGI
jgi:hypothetical protein